MKHTRILLSLAALSFVAACGDSTDPDDGALSASGSMSFSYSGAGNGSYAATGSVPANTSAQTTTDWATGYRDVSDNSFTVISIRPGSGGLFDQVLMYIPRLTPGSVTVSSSCNPDTTNCAELIFLVGTNASGSQFQFLCGLETGTLTISTMNSTRSTGTFSGTGSCFSGAGAQSGFSVTNGSFDVAFVSDIPGGI